MLAVLGALREADIDVFGRSYDLPALRKALASVHPGRNVRRRWELLNIIGLLELRRGDAETAVATLTQASELEARLAGVVDETSLRRARLGMAVAWLRLAETQNCIARHTSQSCILPIGPEGVHVEQGAARKAIELLLALLERGAADEPASEELEALWVLNVAMMTVGEYPDGVPEAYRVPPEAFASPEPFPHFVDVAPAAGVNARSGAGGAIVDDFDGDDVLDVVVSGLMPRGKVEFFHGHGDGTFEDRTSQANLDGIMGGLNIVHADYDNDGWPDLLVLRGGWMQKLGDIPNSLLHNNGDGTFTDVTFAAGLGEVHHPTQTAAWADYDNDGNLDLYVGNEHSSRVEAPCQLFRNLGDGTFVDVAAEAGVQNHGYAKGVAWGDYDADGDPDLFVSNMGSNRLYENLGDGTFQDVARKAGVEFPLSSFPAWFWDHDNDGKLDLFVATFMPTLKPYVKQLLGRSASNAEFPALFRGDGKGHFEDVAEAAGLTAVPVAVTMGANFGDLDNDGYLDFYLGTGYPDYEALMPNRMFRNRAGERFVDITTAGGFGHLQKGHGIAFADVDRDGDQDVYAEMGGAYFGDTFGNALFRNPGFPTHSITLKLVGVRSNRSAIGARIRCEVTEEGRKRSIYRHVDSGGSFGGNPLRQMIGLGSATRVDVLEIHWPTSGTTQVFRDVEADTAFRVVEDEDRLEPIP